MIKPLKKFNDKVLSISGPSEINKVYVLFKNHFSTEETY